ncbi:FAD/NAD(P)-binding domain-containing protein [Aaosphaeria arxii CBS 175.79]|uniref:FAD/NAD(P)-binding domain-containing protein n=1 Tax=Aaosphaeria arxii CBS 175.79 TaxID=1450172 RepID=A0A6A5X9K8_9PLEO|nr:FAD/NAD(P)-binding domain-containing protein [Aaosphaeria arxii CBS 175.79]KAF2009652.1 FAD/NAD(P)-binding domain-containing protein [Aaosphaeria arxii CBS 175.79]
MPKINHVVIAGAGPSGLLLGIMLARNAGIKVTIVDADTKINDNPRAAHYAPSAVYDFHRAGIIDDVRKAGFTPRGVCWRLQDTTFLAGMGRVPEISKYAMAVLPLDQLGPLLVRHFESLPNTEIKWAHKVVDVEQDEKEARVVVETPEGKKTIGGDYVVGADGASSGVRTALFGKEYPGETLDKQIVATNVYLPFDERFGYWDSNFIVHPTDWYMAAKITTDGLWRVTYGDDAGLSREEIVKRQPARYESILPGNPKPGDYKLISMSPYKLQQRCAPSFRVGKILLVADAAHLCNPFGGLGLTGGFADVGSLYDCFIGIHEDQLDEDILDKYSEVRIKIWRDMIDPMSRANFHRLWDDNYKEDREKFFAMCEQATNDPVFGKSVAESVHAIRHDFTQYYKNKSATSTNDTASATA